MDLSLGFLFCSTNLYFCLCASTILFWWLWLCSRAWSGRLIPPVPFFFLKIALAIRGFLYFHTNCETICSSSVNTVGSLIGLHWIYRLLWVVYSFSLYGFFQPNNMVFLHLFGNSTLSEQEKNKPKGWCPKAAKASMTEHCEVGQVYICSCILVEIGCSYSINRQYKWNLYCYPNANIFFCKWWVHLILYVCGFDISPWKQA